MADPFELSGKVVLITGGSRGLGLAMAKAFARCGAHVIVASRKQEACEAVAAQICASGGWATAMPVHMGRRAEIDALVEQAYAACGAIDVLINNAGMSSSEETPEALFVKVMDVNFKGPFRLAALCGSRMARGRGGSIINVSLIGAIKPRPEYAPYSGAKAALNALTTAHAFEFAPKVRVNGIMPGSFRTDIAKHWDADKERNTDAALGRFGEPDEIVSTALYLASDASSFATGTVIRVDGGRP